jgi:hypothetical protein
VLRASANILRPGADRVGNEKGRQRTGGPFDSGDPARGSTSCGVWVRRGVVPME